MAMPEIPGVYRLVLTGRRTDDDDVVNQFHVRGEAGNSSRVADACEALGDALGAGGNTMLSRLSSTLTWYKIVGYDLSPGSGANAERLINVTPTGSGTRLPPQAAIVTTWRTDLRGKSYRGRTYWGPLVSGTLNTDGRVSTTALNAVADASAFIANQMADNGFFLVVASPTLSDAFDITHLTVDDSFDIQRRRGFRNPIREERSLEWALAA